MIILFFTRIAKVARRKSNSKKQDLRRPSEEKENQPGKAAETVPRATSEKKHRSSRQKSRLQDPAPASASPAAQSANRQTAFDRSSFAAKAATAPAPEAPPHKEPAGSQNGNAEKKKQTPQKTQASAGSLSRLKSLPELQKAVLWAEILGKPKGFE